MAKKAVKYLDYIIYWSIVLLPYSVSVSPVPMNVFMGLLVSGFLLKKILKKEKIFIKTPLNFPLLLLFIIACLSAFNSVDLRDTFKGGIIRLLKYIFILLIIAEEVKDKKHITKIIFSVFFGVIYSSFDAIWQVFTGKDFVRGYLPVINIGLVRATASFKDSNVLGIYLSAMAPLIFGLTFYYLKAAKKAVFIFGSLTGLIAIALTYSRPTLLAVFVALFFLAAINKDRRLLSFLVMLMLISPFLLPKSVKEWAKEVDYNPIRFMCNDDRIAIYRHSLNMIKAHPLIGVGANAFMKSYKYYKESPEYRNIITPDEIKAHNNFLHMAAEIGLTGLGIFIWFLYKMFKECKRIYAGLDDYYLRIILISLSACLIAFLTNGLTESSLFYSRVAVIFWYLSGLALAIKKFIPPRCA